MGARAFLIGSVVLALAAASMQADAAETAYLGIVIDDLGNSLREGRRVIALPAPVACAILPHTPYADRLAREAHAKSKEVLLHLPMESQNDEAPGPGVLTTGMPSRELIHTLAYDLLAVPHAVGINNHMGSRLTQQPGAMRVLMQALHNRGDLFFVDSRTSGRSVAARLATEHDVPVLVRDVFLDNEPSETAIRAQLAEALAIARRRGHAIAIGHPHPVTLAVLAKWLPTLAREQVEVVPLAELLRRRVETNTSNARTVRARM